MNTTQVSLPREATLADAARDGIIVAVGILIALALTGSLTPASDIVSAALKQIGRWLGTAPAAESQMYWHMARSAGVIAYLLLWGSMALGLMVTNKVLAGAVNPTFTFELHQFLSIVALAFSGFHAFILLGDNYINFTLADLLIPFKSPYEPIWVGVGILAFYLTALLTISFYVKKFLSHKIWRALHYASFLSWVLITFHGLMAGSDSGSRLMQIVYIFATLSISFLVVYRILVTKTRARRESK